MFIEYDLMPSSSKIWIYQSDRSFMLEEQEVMSIKLSNFIDTWQRHGEDLKASYKIAYNQFIILLVDESFNAISGCSIDASVNLMKQIEKEFNIDLTNKLNISFKVGEHINIVKLPDFQKFAKDQKVTSDTIVFNNMVATKAEFEQIWEVKAKNSWHNRFVSI